ncbi:MAG: DUF3772 domain-containing protein [Hyphomicrobiaceae bacterium]
MSIPSKLAACLLILAGLWLVMPECGSAQAQSPPVAAPVAAPTGQPAPAGPNAPAAAGAPASTPAAKTQPEAVGLPPEALEPVERLARSIEAAEKSIQQLKQIEGELSRLRGDVERIIYDSTATADSLRPQLQEVEKQIQRLGPPPGKDQSPESATVAGERARLNALKAGLDGAIKTAELAWVRAKQLIDRITVMRYQLFTRNLFERRDSPLFPGVWRNVHEQIPTITGRVQYYGGDWMTWAGRVGGWLAALAAAIVVVYALLRLVLGRFVARRLARPEAAPNFFERALRASWIAPLKMVAPAAAVTMAYLGLSELDLLFSPWEGLAEATFQGLLVYVVASGLLSVCFAPKHPAWRLIPVADHTASRILFLLKAFVAIFVIDIVLVELGRAVYVPLSVTVAQSFLTSTAFALLMGWLVLTPFVPLTGADRPVNGHAYVPRPVTLLSPLWIKLPLAATAIMILVSSVLGYVALGRFVAHQVVLTGTVLAACGLLYLAVRAATRGRGDNRDLIGQTLETAFGLVDPVRRRQLSRLIEVMATLVIGTAALPLLMLQWGFSGADIRDWLKALLFGFEVGQFRISLARILIGIALFTLLLFVTRLVQRWLRDSVLVQPRVDPGIANSVDTAVGYVGIGLALLMALSYAGLDITSLAIVAGALSVGIGFGLQSIVNNFVSGLILLVERPVKVGDWIVVGNEQGNVRRISVRSTEIETFDKASLILPNSELITGRVLNWTHRNPMGRAVVKVAVAPTADPDLVIALLRQCVDEHPDALETPAPFITFDNFTGTSLEFTLRAVVSDVYTHGRVASELRIAVLKRLRSAGIQLANPQQDVHLKDLDWIKTAAARAIQQKGTGNGAQQPVSPVADNEA